MMLWHASGIWQRVTQLRRPDKGPSGNNSAILAADASRLAALLVGHMHPACSLLAPCDPGASAPRNDTVISGRALRCTLVERGRTIPPHRLM